MAREIKFTVRGDKIRRQILNKFPTKECTVVGDETIVTINDIELDKAKAETLVTRMAGIEARSTGAKKTAITARKTALEAEIAKLP